MERILRATREKQEVTYKGALIGLPTDYSMETLQARREWPEVFQVMKRKDLQPRLIYPARVSFKMEGKRRIFPRQEKVKGKCFHQTSIVRHAKATALRR